MFTAFLIKYAEIGIKGKNRYLFEDALVQQIKYALKKCEGQFKIHKTQGRIFVDALSEFDFDEVVEHDDVYQVMLACSKDEHAQMIKGVDRVKITGWWEKAIDLIPADGGKGRGIEEMLAYYGFDKSESMAFGDGGNDIEMLQTVGTGVALGNATDKVKAIADDICGDVAEDGIYYYCIEHGLI